MNSSEAAVFFMTAAWYCLPPEGGSHGGSLCAFDLQVEELSGLPETAFR
jgi:hypothetical protein